MSRFVLVAHGSDVLGSGCSGGSRYRVRRFTSRASARRGARRGLRRRGRGRRHRR
ncbi:hypothetical protein Ae505Ps2_6174c [Pseudonocardia sp. Ae505_Ps2]|nr:hypothetical protein Ae505Ps2_6174c [Pseudonocardia sp. Ae505_Ps2]